MTPHSAFHGFLDASGQAQSDCFPATEATLAHDGARDGLLFLGDLYNAADLRQQLGIADAMPLEYVLLQAFRRWSKNCVCHFDGQFVLALWHNDQFHLYRDGSAAHALYYSVGPARRIAFANRLDTLFRLPGVEKRWSRPALHEYLRLLEIAAPNTFYENVFALEAGHWLSWTQHGYRSTRLAADTPAAPGFEQALNTLEHLLQHSIDQQLQHANQPAAFLSGGIDSSLLCALARRSRPDLTAVTVGFADARHDEAPLAHAIAQHLGIRHQVLRFSWQDSLRAFEAFTRDAEQPMADPAIAPTLLAFEQCKAQFDAVLDGSGADESCGAMPPRHVRIGVEYAARLPATLRRAAVAVMRKHPRLAEYTPILDFEHPAELMLRWHGFARAEIETLCGEPVSFEHTQVYRSFARFPRAAHFARSSAVLDALTSDRLHHAASITGLAVRYPYWDRAVDAFIRALPQDYRYLPGQPKRLLRELLARHLPRPLWDVPKHGFDFPLLEFLQAEDFQLVRRYLLCGNWAKWSLLSPVDVAEYGQRFMAGERHLLFRVWALVNLSAWLESHFD
jgi:asparagine synthase (glutamine-hydrolysing)